MLIGSQGSSLGATDKFQRGYKVSDAITGYISAEGSYFSDNLYDKI